MNTISSLLNWIGNLIGADPSTMTTSSKTVVGAVNELNGKLGTIKSAEFQNISTNSSYTFSLEGPARYVLISSGANAGTKGIAIIYCNANGTSSYSVMGGFSSATFTTGTSSIKVQNTNSAAAMYCMLLRY